MPRDSGVLRIDFGREEESGGGRPRWPEGDYHVVIVKAKTTRSAEKDTPGLEVTFKVLEGKKKGKTISDTLWITPKSLTRVRLLLEAVGVKVPKSAVNLPLAKLKGKKLWIELEDDDSGADKGYSVKSRVAFRGFTSKDAYEGADVEDEDLDDDEDDLEEDDTEDEDDEDEDEDDDEEDEDEEEDEEPAPKKSKSKAKSKAKAKAKKKKSKKVDDDDDEDEDIEDIDLDDL